MRLTKIRSDGQYLINEEVICNGNRVDNALKKLGQLEDIEEELGIDLITLFKALKKGFYSKDGEYHHFSNLFFDSEEIYDGYNNVDYYFKDYGKTWALTKEELENE